MNILSINIVNIRRFRIVERDLCYKLPNQNLFWSGENSDVS